MLTFGRLLLTAALLMGLADGVSAAECRAARIPIDRTQAVATNIGRGSFQMDPSTAILRSTFKGPEAAPAVEVVYSGGDRRYTEALVEQALLVRVPCASESMPAQSLELYRTGVVYTGLMRGRAPEPRLKGELDLVGVVRLVKELKSERVRFDFREMNCPFAVEFAPYRPYLPNFVQEIANPETSRAPFFAWLRNITLDIPQDMMVTAIGKTSLLYVPCAVLDLS